MTGKPVACETATGERYASSKPDCQGSSKAETTEWSHNLRVSPATVHHMEAVLLIVREIRTRTPWRMRRPVQQGHILF